MTDTFLRPIVTLAFAIVLAWSASARSAPRVFPTSGSGVINGDVTAIGGTNYAYAGGNYDVDASGLTSDSSSEILTLPAGATIVHATLSWAQDCLLPCAPDGPNVIDTSDFPQSRALLFGPDGVSHVVNADGGTTYTSNPGNFTVDGRRAWADVTSLVQSLYQDGVANQRFTVGNITPDWHIGSGGYARNAIWALFVVYTAPGEPTRAVAVDLHDAALPNPDPDIGVEVHLALTGLQLPPTTVTGTVAVFAGDGQASLNAEENIYIDQRTAAQRLTNAANPANGVWNHSISYLGVDSTTALPTPSSRPSGGAGIDLDVFAIDGLPTPGATEIDLIATTTPVVNGSQEFVVILGLGLAVDVDQPDVTLQKTVTLRDAGGGVDPTGAADVGDLLDYGVLAANGGNAEAIDLVFSDAFPPGTSWVADSLIVGGVAVADGDPAVTLTADTVAVELGSLAVGADVTVAFRLAVDQIGEGDAIVNVARADYASATSAVAFAATSNAVLTPACGNALVEAGEECDDGSAAGSGPCACTPTCTAPDGAVACDDDDVCTDDACVAGACDYTPAEAGLACDDGSLCTTDDACDGAGACVGTDVVCGAPLTCDVNTCDEATGLCAEHDLSCVTPVFFGVVTGPGDTLGSIRCTLVGGVVSCDMNGGVLAVGPPMCQ